MEEPKASLEPTSQKSTFIRLLSLFLVTLTPVVRYIYPRFHHVSTLAVVSGGILVIIQLFANLTSANDPYGSFHLPLNQLPGDPSDLPPKTEWLNMGYWKSANTFPEACRALAMKLLQAAKCKNGGNVLDVGYGSGDSLILLLSDPSVPHPHFLTGITTLLTHYRRSQDRVRDLRLSHIDTFNTSVRLYHGDAVFRMPSAEHPLDPSLTSLKFDTILALDCAYHFNTRQDFLRQSFSRLAAGGRIALADICFSSSALRDPRTRFAISLLRMVPKQNMVTPEKYAQDLTEIGYTDVMIEDVTADVFPGFVMFLRSRGLGWSIFGGFIQWYSNIGARFVIVSASKD